MGQKNQHNCLWEDAVIQEAFMHEEGIILFDDICADLFS